MPKIIFFLKIVLTPDKTSLNILTKKLGFIYEVYKCHYSGNIVLSYEHHKLLFGLLIEFQDRIDEVLN